jgi:hypothetical protein
MSPRTRTRLFLAFCLLWVVLILGLVGWLEFPWIQMQVDAYWLPSEIKLSTPGYGGGTVGDRLVELGAYPSGRTLRDRRGREIYFLWRKGCTPAKRPEEYRKEELEIWQLQQRYTVIEYTY